MGDPRRLKKKYDTPSHPWQAETITEERGLLKEYGLRNKKELWKMSSLLKAVKDQAKKLIPLDTPQANKEKKLLLKRLETKGLLAAGSVLDDVLDIHLRVLLDRRLQSFVHKQNLARSVMQARQVITHRHISINGKKITSPGYLVLSSEEQQVAYAEQSKMAETSHPERAGE